MLKTNVTFFKIEEQNLVLLLFLFKIRGEQINAIKNFKNKSEPKLTNMHIYVHFLKIIA